MRGKRKPKPHDPSTERITPAYAGKTLRQLLYSAAIADHPRVCGENYAHSLPADLPCGSPPRMRGKHLPSGTALLLNRITPAYAGKTMCFRLSVLLRADHPRVCGENVDFKYARGGAYGSPPRMRGKLILPLTFGGIRRITPAYAGKTISVSPFAPAATDHPRVCGENHVNICVT